MLKIERTVTIYLPDATESRVAAEAVLYQIEAVIDEIDRERTERWADKAMPDIYISFNADAIDDRTVPFFEPVGPSEPKPCLVHHDWECGEPHA